MANAAYLHLQDLTWRQSLKALRAHLGMLPLRARHLSEKSTLKALTRPSYPTCGLGLTRDSCRPLSHFRRTRRRRHDPQCTFSSFSADKTQSPFLLPVNPRRRADHSGRGNTRMKHTNLSMNALQNVFTVAAILVCALGFSTASHAQAPSPEFELSAAHDVEDPCTEQHGPEGGEHCNDPDFCGDPEICGQCAYDAETDHCSSFMEAMGADNHPMSEDRRRDAEAVDGEAPIRTLDALCKTSGEFKTKAQLALLYSGEALEAADSICLYAYARIDSPEHEAYSYNYGYSHGYGHRTCQKWNSSTWRTENITYTTDQACNDSGGWVGYDEWRFMGRDCSALRLEAGIDLAVCHRQSDWELEPNFVWPANEPYELWNLSLADAEASIMESLGENASKPGSTETSADWKWSAN